MNPGDVAAQVLKLTAHNPEPSKFERPETRAQGDSEFKLEAITARELAALPEPPASQMLVGPLVVRGARTIIVADTGHGKTTFALQLVEAVLTGSIVLGHNGAGDGPAVVVDLEQGLRSIKRAITEAGLAERDDVLYVRAPDGLALDSNTLHRAELGRIIAEHRPAVVVLDPHYKAHRGDANEERAVVDLMRFLDHLRATFGFGLILPAHPRKDQTGRDGARKLKLDDVAGSGAITRGAELVIGLERLSHGFARLRILKDRDGDLAVGEEWPLVFTRGEGFMLDPKAETSEEDLEQRILELGSDGTWRISKEYATELRVQHMRAKRKLDALVETEKVETAVGPAGRSSRAVCYRTAPEPWERLGAVDLSLPDARTAPPLPTVIENRRSGSGSSSAPKPGAVGIGEDGYLERVFAAFEAGHITEGEWHRVDRAHRFVVQASR